MEESFLSLDFGSNQIAACLTVYDTATATCRVSYSKAVPCSSISASYILDFDRTVRTVSNLLAEMSEYASFSPTVIVGLRGNFLSFRHTSGFLSIHTKNQLITEKEVQTILDSSIPNPLGDEIELVHLLPQCFTLDGKMGVNPVGLTGNNLEVESFISCALRSHLNNLNRVMTAAGQEDFIVVPTILTLCDSLLKPEETKAGVLLLDIGAQNSSAALYHKGLLEGAWEIPIGADIITQEVSDTLQNELKEKKKILRDYTYGEDEILDEVLDEAAKKLLKKIHHELVQSLSYIKYAPHQVVLTGGGATMATKNAAKPILGARRVRLASHDQLIANSEDMLAPTFTSALSLALHTQKHGAAFVGNAPKEKPTGFFQRILATLGLN